MTAYELLDTAGYISYFEKVAQEANFIDNFFYTYDQMIEKGKTTKKGSIMVLEPYSNQLSENQNDNVLGMRRGFFAIIKPYSGMQNIPAVQGECELLAYKIIGRLKRDSRVHILRAPISNYSGSETPPISPQYVGYGFEFSFEAPVNRFMKFEEADWTMTVEEEPEEINP